MLNQLMVNLTQELVSCNYLSHISRQLQKNFNLKLLIGSEIEFYLLNISIDELQSALPEYIFTIERGNKQFEYIIGPYSDSEQVVSEINASINKITNTAKNLGGIAIFHPKPYIQDYGNALQFNFSFPKITEANFIEFFASSLCNHALETCAAFLTSEDDYLRLNHNFMAPTHIAYGFNNRSCLIRIIKEKVIRLEYRLASPITPAYLALSTLLTSLYKAAENPQSIKSFLPIYGNAADLQYSNTQLPTTLQQAIKLFNYQFFLLQ